MYNPLSLSRGGVTLWVGNLDIQNPDFTKLGQPLKEKQEMLLCDFGVSRFLEEIFPREGSLWVYNLDIQNKNFTKGGTDETLDEIQRKLFSTISLDAKGGLSIAFYSKDELIEKNQ